MFVFDSGSRLDKKSPDNKNVKNDIGIKRNGYIKSWSIMQTRENRTRALVHTAKKKKHLGIPISRSFGIFLGPIPNQHHWILSFPRKSLKEKIEKHFKLLIQNQEQKGENWVLLIPDYILHKIMWSDLSFEIDVPFCSLDACSKEGMLEAVAEFLAAV